MKILLLDVETTPNKGWFWGLFKQTIAINQIEEPGYTLCYAAKWLDRDEVIYDSLRHSSMEQMMLGIHVLLNEADAVIHYNGNKFDMPTLNKEFILQGLTPPAPYTNIDLFNIVRSSFRFTSNKLDYICQQLGLGAKVKHKGMELWRGCMQNRSEDWDVMQEYNIEDVMLLERLYYRLLPWITKHPNHGLYVDNDGVRCPNCGGTHMQKRGKTYTRLGVYQRYWCVGCGHWSRGKKMMKGVEAR